MAARGKKIAYIKRGLFSYSNVRTLEQLRARFEPEYEIEVLDIIDAFLRPRPWVAARNALEIARLYAPKLLARKQGFRSAFYRTPYIARAIREFVLERLGPRSAEFAFTFQTQSLYDAHLPGVPHFVYTDHTHLANLGYPSFDRDLLCAPAWIDCEREIYRNASLNLVMGSHVARSLVEDYGVEPKRAVTVHAGSNIDPSTSPLENDAFANGTILFVGIDWERKGGPALLEAFDRVAAEVPRARLVIAGCEPRTSHPRVEVLGKIPRADVTERLRRASVLCLPTRIEPFGIACIEAFMHGIPVVATRIGAIPDMIAPGSGHLVPPDDPAALATALIDLLSDPAKARAAGELGRAHVLRHFTWDATGEKIAAAIRATLGTA